MKGVVKLWVGLRTAFVYINAPLHIKAWKERSKVFRRFEMWMFLKVQSLTALLDTEST